MTDQLIVSGIGSTDWTGGRAPAGGMHTGTCVITMTDAVTFTVAHSRAEALTKIAVGKQASNPGAWVAFDQPSSPSPVVLNATLVASVH